MFIISVAPLTKIPLPNPQTLSYFHRRKLNIGSIVLISIKNRDAAGVVINCEKLTPVKKMQLKKTANFTLKKIKKILCKKSFIKLWQINIAKEIARYYYEPLGICLKLFIPQQILKKMTYKDYAIDNDAKSANSNAGVCFEKYDFNKEIILNKIRDNKDVTLLIASDVISAQNWHNYLKKYFKAILIRSNLSQKRRLGVWFESQKLTDGVLIGTRAALWYLNPFVKLIILLNAGSDYHKSWDQHPKYDVRHIVRIMNKELGIKVIFYDIAPPLDLYQKQKNHKMSCALRYDFVNLKNIDESLINEENIFSKALLENLKKIISQNGRAILYLNKKGYAKVILCRSCRFIPKCDNCLLSLSLRDNNLMCIVCGKSDKAFNVCPKCGNHNFIFFRLGGDFIYEKIRKNFPKIKIFKFDLNNCKSAKDQIKILNELYKNSASILLGTSLLFKITPDFFPKVDLAVALNIDSDLFYPEYNTVEKTYLNMLRLQAISNKLIIQSFQDKLEKFNYDEELKMREMLKYPPFYKIVKITVSPKKTYDIAPEVKMLYNFLAEVSQRIIKKLNLRTDDIIPLGPVKKITKKGAQYNIIIKFSTDAFRHKNKLLQLIPIKVDIDVEPKSIL